MAGPILIVEDDHDEVVLLERALKRAGVTVPTTVVVDGRAAIQYLEQWQGSVETTNELPQFVLLDLNLPRGSGLDVLRWVRQHQLLRRLPVVVLTSSDEPSDIVAAYDLGANSYVVKPNGFRELGEVARRLREYWLELNAPAPAREVRPRP